MRRLTTLLLTLTLMSCVLWADETITVSANSSDISEGLDLKVVAKLFAEAKNLEQFEMMLNNPDSAFCNLDLNGDGQVDYLRVVETGEGNKRLIVLQAILAKDIYQDVASIYVEKDASDNVSVQVIGDEYLYGTNYIIEPVYIYRPIIYDWFWGPNWCAWNSPWYWGYYPGWWYAHACWDYDWYWHRCYAWHHCHHWCSFRTGRAVYAGYTQMYSGVTRRDFADAHPDRSFSRRNSGMTNAREIRSGGSNSDVHTRQIAVGNGSSSATRSAGVATRQSDATTSRTYGSRITASTRTTATSQRTSGSTETSSSIRTSRTSGSTSSSRSTATATRSTGTTRSTATTQRSTGSTYSGFRSTGTTRTSATAQRSTGSTYSGSRTTSASSSSTNRSGGSVNRSGGYSGGGSVSRGGGYSGGGGSVSRGGGGTVTRR